MCSCTFSTHNNNQTTHSEVAPLTGLTDASQETLRTILFTQEDLPPFLAESAQPKNLITARSANPPECLPRLPTEQDEFSLVAQAYAPDFTNLFYDGRFALEYVVKPQNKPSSIVFSADQLLADCASFNVSLPGNPELYPAFIRPLPMNIPSSTQSTGMTITYALAKSDPFRNEVFYCAIGSVRDIQVLVVSGLPGVVEKLLASAIEKLTQLK